MSNNMIGRNTIYLFGLLSLLACQRYYRIFTQVHLSTSNLPSAAEELDAVMGWIKDVGGSYVNMTSLDAFVPSLSTLGVTGDTNSTVLINDDGESNVHKTPNNERLWTNMDDVLPDWIRQYFDWHVQERSKEPNNDETKYFVVQCLDTFTKCGGLSDRLRPMAFYILLAQRAKRVLLIRWSRPCALEEFLIPPEGGIDWRFPDFLANHTPKGRGYTTGQMALQREKSKDKVVTASIQVWDGGQQVFDKHSEGGKFHDVSAAVFRCFFVPSKPIQKRVDATMSRLNLQKGGYTGAHVRARYPTRHIKGQEATADKEGSHKFLESFSEIGTNAVNCALSLQPRSPIYFASDSHHLVNYMLYNSTFAKRSKTGGDGGTSSGRQIRAIEHPSEPLHLDTADFRNKKPEDFYPLFEDIFMLGEAACMSFGMGTYGRFAQLFNTNISCYINHRNYRGIIQKCAPPEIR